jgi:hypothetical protein
MSASGTLAGGVVRASEVSIAEASAIRCCACSSDSVPPVG